MTRNYTSPTIDAQWAADRQTDMAVAVAIHAIADRISTRSPAEIWSDPTPPEFEHVCMAVEEYVVHGDYAANEDGYCWGQETVPVAACLNNLSGTYHA